MTYLGLFLFDSWNQHLRSFTITPTFISLTSTKVSRSWSERSGTIKPGPKATGRPQKFDCIPLYPKKITRVRFLKDRPATASSLQVEGLLETGPSTYRLASTRRERECGVRKGDK